MSILFRIDSIMTRHNCFHSWICVRSIPYGQGGDRLPNSYPYLMHNKQWLHARQITPLLCDLPIESISLKLETLIMLSSIWFGSGYPYPSGLLYWHWGNHVIAPVPVKPPWRILEKIDGVTNKHTIVSHHSLYFPIYSYFVNQTWDEGYQDSVAMATQDIEA